MDDRIREHAATLVDWSARIEAGDRVVVAVDEAAHDLGVAVAERLGDVGAVPQFTYRSGELRRAYLLAHDGDFEATPIHGRALYEGADAVLSLRGGYSTTATADVPADRQSAYGRSREAVREARMATDWVSTIHPTRALAQRAGMSYPAFADLVYDATLRDWASLAREMDRLKERLDDAERVRIVAEGTDVTLDVTDRIAVNSSATVADDSHNLPSGEVFTAPASADGTVAFDLPRSVRGRRVRNVRLQLEDGVVTDYAAAEGEDVLAAVLATDEGARRIGELGIGMNRGVGRVTDTVMLDEKMAGTVHLALGRAYAANYPPEHRAEAIDSAVHLDLIRRMGEGSRLEVDGEVLQRDGVFAWEDA